MQTKRLPMILPTVLFLALGLFALTAVVVVDNATAKAARAVKQITLTPASAYPGVTGKAKWESSGGGRELEVEIEHATALKGKTLTVKTAGGALVASGKFH